MSCNAAFNIKNVPVNATWEIEEAFCLSTKDLTVAELVGKYFIVYNAAGTDYAVWFDDNVVADPVIAGSPTLVPVAVAAVTTAAGLATAIAAAINGTAAMNFTSTVSNSTTVKSVYDDTSKVASVENGDAGALLQLTRVQVGGSIDLGLLDGDVSFDPTIEVLDVTAHQTGLVVQSQLITSVGGTVSLVLKEYKPALYREIFEAIGGKVATTSITGFGSSMVGKNLLATAKRLKLKPVGATDETQTYTIFKAVPELGAITFSGETPNTLPLEFTAYIDDSVSTVVNVWAYGDIATLP